MGMERSMFGAYIDKFFKRAVGKITELINGKKNESELLHETMLDEEYSADLTWNSTALNQSVVAADVVSMDSSLPLKKRSTIRTASGDIAKLGIKYQLREKAISDINVMKAKGQNEAEIASKILNNVPRAIRGIKMRVEIMFQQAFSQGFCLVENDTNDGTGVRASFGYLDSHTLHATTAPWSDATYATPIDDIRAMVDLATSEGREIRYFYMSEQYFNLMRKTKQVIAFVASANNQVIIDASPLPQPGRQKTLDALRDEFNAEFVVVNGSYKIEKPDGSEVTIKPWVQPNIVGCQSNKVGRLVYGTLAEDLNRVAGVTYEKSGYILVSEYSHNEPSLAEFTAAQALAMPVIDDGQDVFILHADSTGVLTVDPETLSYTAAGGTKKVAFHADSSVTVTKSEGATWLTVTKSGSQLSVKATANESTARTATITVTDANSNTATVSVSQAAAATD